MSELPEDPPAAGDVRPATPPAAPKRRKGDGRISFATILCGLALLAAAGAWYGTQQQLNGTRAEVARQLQASAAEARDAHLRAREAQEALREMQAKLGALEAKQAETLGQQSALETLYQDLSRNRDDWVLAEIEQMLSIASQQLQLAGNVQAALLALQSADARLARSDRPQLLSLRKAITRDIEKLRNAPSLDVTGLTLRLDQVLEQVDNLPLLADAHAEQFASTATMKADDPWWKRWPKGAWTEIKQLVRVERLDAVDQQLLSPDQRYFARENLRLRLLHARLSLLQRDQNAYKGDVQAALDLVKRHFDTRERSVSGAITTLTQLNNTAINVELPSISESLSAVQTAKLPRERVR
jgi:uroporphyrin-III C-methyltransferase